MALQTFADLVSMLRAQLPALRTDPRSLTVAVGGGQSVELVRIDAGAEEWAAMTVWIGTSAPPHHAGLGVLTRWRHGWALRLTFPVAEVSQTTFLRSAVRLAHEARLIRGLETRARDVAVFEMWAS